MGLIEIASNNSVWRGMDYYNNKKVVSWESSGTGIYEGVVSGSEGNTYIVHIDTEHPRKSSCNCPFADGRRVVCKHMIALYFTAEPKVAEDFLKEVEKWEAKEAEREQQHYEEMKKYVKSLSKTELQEQLLDALLQLEERRNYW
ncbi:MAG: SWIM zinc finger family protein [Lachnospiraceae bacterium]|nr:SWIM zinc finger family protein [Lachnospiraceae bacterium]